VFTGLIEEVGVVRRIDHTHHSAQIRIAADRVLDDVKLGDSIAVNGACLTVVSFAGGEFVADAVPETMRRTNLGRLQSGARVNLERALRLGDRLGGHIVSGHVDGVGVVRDITREGIATVFTIEAPADVMRYVVEKGSICVDGVSLTVMDTRETTFRLSIIPHTGEHTALQYARVGQWVNLECDLLAKYVEKMLAGREAAPVRPGLDLEFLQRHGFA
jgi:riboflavin synthase